MNKQTRAKQERVIEAVRRGLEGDAAVEFIQKGGFAMTSAGIARHLRSMGGRGKVQELVEQGCSNVEILERTFPDEDMSHLHETAPSQTELFDAESLTFTGGPGGGTEPEFETRKVVLKLPADLYEAIRLAAKGEGKSQNQLIVDILTSALSRMPEPPQSLLEDFRE